MTHDPCSVCPDVDGMQYCSTHTAEARNPACVGRNALSSRRYFDGVYTSVSCGTASWLFRVAAAVDRAQAQQQRVRDLPRSGWRPRPWRALTSSKPSEGTANHHQSQRHTRTHDSLFSMPSDKATSAANLTAQSALLVFRDQDARTTSPAERLHSNANSPIDTEATAPSNNTATAHTVLPDALLSSASASASTPVSPLER